MDSSLKFFEERILRHTDTGNALDTFYYHTGYVSVGQQLLHLLDVSKLSEHHIVGLIERSLNLGIIGCSNRARGASVE